MTQRSDLAAFILRVGLGVMYLAHSIVLKLATFGLHGTAQFFVSVGLPSWLAYVTFAAEAVGGVLLILGMQTRWVVLSLTPALAGAIIWVHAGNGWVFTAPNGGWEYPAFLIVASLVQALLGDGSYALSRRAQRPLPSAS
jgi:putative oxidoreductase